MKHAHKRGAAGVTNAALSTLVVMAIALATAQGAAAAPPQVDLASSPLGELLDMEVSGASKFTLRMSEAASSVTVVTADQMRALGHRTLADVLRSMRSVVVSTDRTYAYLGVRGLSLPGDYNTRVLLLIDGNRVNDPVFDQALLGSEFPIDLDLVERVEFIPGQGSAVHGANALYGVVNVVTRHPAQAPTREMALSLGQGRSRQGRLTGSIGLSEGATLLLSATALRMAGTDAYYAFADTPATNNGISHDTDHERTSQFFAHYSGSELSASFIYFDRIKGLTKNADTVFGDPGSLYRDMQSLFDLSYGRRVDESSHWKLRAYAGSYSFRGDYVMDVTPVTLNRDGAQSRWWGVEANYLTEHIVNHKLVVGTDLRFATRRDQTNADMSPALTYLDDHHPGNRQAVYAEDRWTVAPTVSLTLGARYDKAETGEGSLSPRLSAVWRPSEQNTFKFIHGRAFRPPNAYETYYSTPTTGGYKGNLFLRSEQATGDEVMAEYRPSAATRWTLSAYSTQSRRLLVQQADPVDGLLVFTNAGEFTSQGIEAEAEHVWPDGARIRANYGVQRIGAASDESLEGKGATHLGKLIATAPLMASWTVGIETVMIGRRADVAGYGTTNLTLSKSLAERRGLVSFSAYDLFNRSPSDPGADSVLQSPTPLYGRSLRLKLELVF